MIIGAFKMLRNVVIFTDNASKYEDVTYQDEKVRVFHPHSTDILRLDFAQLLSPWGSFRNREPISELEGDHLNQVMVKFIKQLAGALK